MVSVSCAARCTAPPAAFRLSQKAAACSWSRERADLGAIEDAALVPEVDAADDCQANGVQTRQRRSENIATIEGGKSVAQGRRRRQIPKRHRVIKMPANHAA